MDFAFFPAIDLRGGKRVQLVGGVPGTEVVALDDPLAQAERWVEQGSLAEVMVRKLKEGDGEIKPLLSEMQWCLRENRPFQAEAGRCG